MKIGEVYFIGERDRSTGELTPNVKIGKASGDEGSLKRLKDELLPLARISHKAVAVSDIKNNIST